MTSAPQRPDRQSRPGCPGCAADQDAANAGSHAASLTRRGFLGRGAGLAAAVAVGLTAPQLTTRIAYAATPEYTGDTLVVLSLRGGFDGLSAIVPLGDPGYQAARPTIAVPPSQALPTGDRYWGLHPALAPLLPWWNNGTFGAVHAVGAPDPSRSHFAATAEMERAAPGSQMRTGWIDRALGLRPGTGVFQGTQVGGSLIPQSMAGPFTELGLPGIDRFTLNSAWGDTPGELAADEKRWARALLALASGTPALEPAAAAGLAAVTTARGITQAGSGPANGARYPHTVEFGPYAESHLSAALLDTARLIRARVGVQIVCIEYGDWDMHAGLGTVGAGRFTDRLAEWAACMQAFLTDIGPAGLDNVTVLTMSEFGRRVAENGDQGTDHGLGNAMLLLGGGVNGGVVHGAWPGLDDGNLDDGDLKGTTDYRDVLAEALTRRCRQPASDLGSVFPNKGTFTPVGLFTPKA